jgi:hypothetical protein
VKDAIKIKIRTVRYKPDRFFRVRWQLQVVGQSGRILILCNLHRLPYRGGGYYYESDTYSTRRDTLEAWREYVRLHLMDLAREFVQAERCAVCVDIPDGVDADCMAECAARFRNQDHEERIRIRLKG